MIEFTGLLVDCHNLWAGAAKCLVADIGHLSAGLRPRNALPDKPHTVRSGDLALGIAWPESTHRTLTA